MYRQCFESKRTLLHIKICYQYSLLGLRGFACHLPDVCRRVSSYKQQWAVEPKLTHPPGKRGVSIAILLLDAYHGEF